MILIDKIDDAYTNLIYKECLNWIVDYIHEEISFRVMVTNFDHYYKLLVHNKDEDEKIILSENKRMVLFGIHLAIDHRIEAIYHDDAYYSEENLKNKLTEIINNQTENV